MKTEPLVSVVIPTKNSEKTIERCLESVRDQTYQNIEIIVVDNFSQDKTREIAKRYEARVYLMGSERAAQVNFGAKKAKGDYIYRVDSDFVLETTLVEEAVNKSEKDGYDAIAVHNTSDPMVSFWSKVRKLERDCYRDDELNIGARFLKKKVFSSVGGFNEGLVAAEDYDLHNRLLERHFRIGRINALETHIGEPKTLADVVRKHYCYGKTIEAYVERNPHRAQRQLSPMRWSYFKHRSEFRSPILTVGFIIYQFVRYSSAAIGFLEMKLWERNK